MDVNRRDGKGIKEASTRTRYQGDLRYIFCVLVSISLILEVPHCRLVIYFGSREPGHFTVVSVRVFQSRPLLDIKSD